MQADLPTLDVDHLSRQTFGDRELEADLLVLFDRQCLVLPLMIDEGASRRAQADAAHTLVGAARAVGAHRVAAVAARLEEALSVGQAASDQRCALDDAIGEVRRAIARRTSVIAAAAA